MSNEITYAMVSGGGVFVVTFLVAWGMHRSTVAEHDRRLIGLEAEVTKQLELIHGLRDVYVSQKYFNEIMRDLKDSQQEFRTDLKKVLELVSSLKAKARSNP